MSRIKSECAPIANLKLRLLPVELKVNKKLPAVKLEANTKQNLSFEEKSAFDFDQRENPDNC